MILSKLGTPFRNLKKAVERLFCGFLAALVLFVNATAPVRAAGTLATITGAAVVSAWLMACGIYPYVNESGQSFGEWGASQLQDLADQYAATDPIGDFGLSEFTGFVTGKTIAIAKGSWEKLRAFAQWIVSQFSVTDNQTGVELGAALPSGYEYVPSLAYQPTYQSIIQDGYVLPGNTSSRNYFLGFYEHVDYPTGVIVAYNPTNNPSYTGDYRYFFFVETKLLNTTTFPSMISFPSGISFYGTFTGNGTLYSYTNAIRRTASSGKYIYVVNGTFEVLQSRIPSSVLAFDSEQKAIDFLAELTAPDEISSIVTADTTKVSIPDVLPETATYGGLTVPDSIAPTVPAIESVIEQGVTDRTQPLVIPTVVEIPADTEITDDGTITENPVVVTPEMALPSVADLSLPASVIAEFKTRFPFCLPWDIMSFLSALSHTAQAPVITCDIPDPFTGQTFTITVDLSPWDDVAAIVRHFESVIIAVGFALGFRRFVLIGAHS